MIAVPWYENPEEYNALLRVAEDTDELFSSFSEWFEQATKVTSSLEKNGYRVVRVPISVDRWAAWCGEQRLERTEQSRSLYVAKIADLLELHQGDDQGTAQ